MSFAAFLAVQAPWIIRNQHVLGSPVLTTTHGGYTLLLGHNAVYYRDVVARRWGTVWVGESLADWQAELERELSQQSPPLDFRPGQVDEIARDRWMSRRAWEVIRSDPVMAIRSGLTLLGRFWNVAPQDTGEQSRLVRWCVGAWYAVLFITAVVGLTRVMRSRDCAWLPLILLLVGFTLVHTLYWSDMRMRAPLSPALALLAAAAFWRRETTALLTLRVIRPAAPDAR